MLISKILPFFNSHRMQIHPFTGCSSLSRRFLEEETQQDCILAFVPFRGGQADCPRARTNEICAGWRRRWCHRRSTPRWLDCFLLPPRPKDRPRPQNDSLLRGTGTRGSRGRKGSVLGKSVRAARGVRCGKPESGPQL